MKEKTAVDELIENLSKRGLTCDIHEAGRNFIIPGSDRYFNKKFVITSIDSMYFIAFDSYGTKAHTSETYTGLYSKINLPLDAECNIYIKDWVDIFFRYNKHKTGNNFIDQNLTITSRSGWTPRGILSTQDVLDYIKIAKSIFPIKMIIKNNYLSIIKDLKETKIIGIESDVWLYKKSDLDLFLNTGGQIISRIIKACT